MFCTQSCKQRPSRAAFYKISEQEMAGTNLQPNQSLLDD